MADSADVDTLPRTYARLALAFAATSLLWRAMTIAAAPLSDEAAHLVGSWTLLSGGRLYLDFVDNKPPLLYVFYAAAQLIFGRGLVAVRALNTIVVVPLTAYAAFVFHGRSRAGQASAVAFLVAGTAFALEDALAVNTEGLMLLPAAWAFVLMRDARGQRLPRAACAGALLAVASLFKVTAVFWLPVLPLFAWIAGRESGRWRAAGRALAAVLIGFSVPMLAVTLWLASQGAAFSALDLIVLRNFSYVTEPTGAREAVIRALRGAMSWALCTLPLWWAAWSSRPRMRSEAYAWTPLLLLVCAMPSVFLGLRFFGHYYLQVLFPLCLAAGPTVAVWLIRPGSRVGNVSLAVLALVFVLSVVGNGWALTRHNILEGTRPVYADVASVVRKDRCSIGSTLFVWGIAPEFYVASRIRPASRFVLPQETISGFEPGRSGQGTAEIPPANAGHDWDVLLADLERNHATYVLDTAPSGLHRWGAYPVTRFPAFAAYLRAHYERMAVVDGVVIYRRHGCVPAVTN